MPRADLTTTIDGEPAYWHHWSRCPNLRGSVYPRGRLYSKRAAWLIEQFRILGPPGEMAVYVPPRGFRLLGSYFRRRRPDLAEQIVMIAAKGLESLVCVCSARDHVLKRTPYFVLGGVPPRRGHRIKGKRYPR